MRQGIGPIQYYRYTIVNIKIFIDITNTFKILYIKNIVSILNYFLTYFYKEILKDTRYQMEELLQHAIDALNNFPISEVVSILTKLKSQKSHTYQDPERLEISLTKNSVFINSKEFISSRAKNTYRIFHILFKQYMSDLLSLKHPEDYVFLSIDKIADILETDGSEIESPHNQVRRIINRLRENIQKNYKIDLQDLIEFSPWNGLGDKNFGYRLNSKKISVSSTPNAHLFS